MQRGRRYVSNWEREGEDRPGRIVGEGVALPLCAVAIDLAWLAYVKIAIVIQSASMTRIQSCLKAQGL